ncbi:FAD dependent oxidoreductase-like protein [Amylocarpus encephaloides]|uniref:FAD dependent oxidoreductase-like protein n=1 Tax=Amylocarpus encephaloides TaxID=45428 RepID=A0A9P7YKC7_9HELO|nr:FAD dependent oxidoreductase-like protein [Amylocarpus encephaloides]
MVSTPSSGQATLPTATSTSSFWHREPSKLLLGHRTTPTLPTSADVVIIGSGISGAFAAHFLRQNEEGRNLDVVMLEAREACWGATGRNGGHCQPAIYSSSADVGKFELRNYQYLEKFVESNRIPCQWVSTQGCHDYTDESMFKASLEHYKILESEDPEVAKLVKVITKDSTNPSLEDLRIPDAVGAFVQTYAASLWPYKLVCHILEQQLNNTDQSLTGKFNLQTNTPVNSIQKSEDGSWIVHTTRGMMEAKILLLTTNGYTSHLLPRMSDLLVPVQGEMSALIPPPTTDRSSSSVGKSPLQKTYVFAGHDPKKDIYQDDYLIQRSFSNPALSSETEPVSSLSGGELMFGGGRHYASGAGVGVSDDSFIDLTASSYLRRRLPQVLSLSPSEPELKASHEWTGIMGFSRDGRPWVGRVSEELGLEGGKGLWISAGFTGHGMPNATLSAKAVVDLMLGKDAKEVDLPGAYRVSRDRIEKARLGDEVRIADTKGFFI